MKDVAEPNSRSHGMVPVLAALIGNLFIFLIKLLAAFLSGSSILFSESVHSLADSFNQALLLIGIKRSKKKPDADYHYGYGHERFFWALVSACGVFFVGAGATIYGGIHSLSSEKEILINSSVYLILAISLIVETITLLLAFKELYCYNDKGLLWAMKHGDPSTLAVLYEDSVAVLGVVIAIISISLVKLTGQTYWDAIGSIVIGILLGVVALILINKNRGYLIEKSVPQSVKQKIIKKLEKDPMIENVLDFKSSILDIDNYRVKCEVEINGSALFKEAFKKKELKAQHLAIKDDYNEFLKFCVEYSDKVPRLIGSRIDRIEGEIKKDNPKIKHIDLEVN